MVIVDSFIIYHFYYFIYWFIIDFESNIRTKGLNNLQRLPTKLFCGVFDASKRHGQTYMALMLSTHPVDVLLGRGLLEPSLTTVTHKQARLLYSATFPKDLLSKEKNPNPLVFLK